jgi:3-phenylpropionate/trans-cinnamate dioxygenase ferredoxin reductase component
VPSFGADGRGNTGGVNASDLLVIGSGPAGISAAESFREHDANGSIVILTDDPDHPYERPPLSKDYLRGETDEVAMHDAQWFAERRIELRHVGRVDGIGVTARTVSVGGQDMRYRSLVLACGSGPTPMPIPGGDKPLQLRSLADAARLREAGRAADSAVVIGAGFIGCEAAASLAMRGVNTTVVAPDAAPQITRLGPDAGARLRGLLEDAGVRYVGDVAVRAIDDGAVHLDNGVTIDTDLILAATGVTPRIDLAKRASLAIEDGRIVVGADMRTSVDGIYAAGDVALTFNTTADRHVAVEHWQDAMDQGAVAGANAAGASAQWDSVPGFWSTIGDATIKYHAWGDGYERCRMLDRNTGFTVWYESGGTAVGVLTYNADDDYDQGEKLIAGGRPAPVPMT